MEKIESNVNEKDNQPHIDINFSIQAFKDPNSKLIFKQKHLLIQTKAKTQQISYQDLIGYKCTQLTQNKYQLQLNSFSKIKKLFSKQKRYFLYTKFNINTNQHQLQYLKIIILSKTTNRKITSSNQLLRFLIYFNPNAGSNSKIHLNNITKFFALTNFTYDIIETTHRNHCKEHLNQVNKDDYQGVVIISGDGLMHQFVNSPMAQVLPVTHVPAGSGNAFAKTQTMMAGEDCNDQIAIYLAVKGRTVQMNLIKMQLEKQIDPIYSFLSLEWAFLADIDMNSEFLRMFGGLRFEIYSAYRCLVLKRYSGKLTYSETQSNLPPLNQPINNPSFITIQSNFLNSIFLSIPFISDKYQFAPLLKVEDRAIDMQFTTQQQGRLQLVKYLLASQKGEHFDRQKKCKKQGYNFGNAKIKSYRLEPQGVNMGLFGIDGERYQAQRMQASVSEKRIMTFI